MRILLTNDDGINARGLAALAAEIEKIADVTIVAPDTEMSAVGHAITINDPLQIKKVKKNDSLFGYAVSGTPADCIKIAYWALLRDQPKPDLLISGINQGANTGINTIYSGTVSAATEGAILGIPAFAISLASYTDQDFSTAAAFARTLATQLRENTLPAGIYLNVNVPPVPKSEIQGIAITRQGRANWIDDYSVFESPQRRRYYWLTGTREEIEDDENVDDHAIEHNKISITPVHFDLTYYPFLDKLKNWKIDF